MEIKPNKKYYLNNEVITIQNVNKVDKEIWYTRPGITRTFILTKLEAKKLREYGDGVL